MTGPPYMAGSAAVPPIRLRYSAGVPPDMTPNALRNVTPLPR
jgi:hypothetical protein